MYKHYFLNMTAVALLSAALLMIGLTARLTSHISSYGTADTSFEATEVERINYVLLLPPPQRVSAVRAPLTDVRYSELKDAESPNYLARGNNLPDLLTAANLTYQEARLWAEAIAQVFDLTAFKVPHRISLHSVNGAVDGAVDDGYNRLKGVKIRLTPTSYVEAYRKGGAENNVIFAEQRQIPSFKRQFLVSADIKKSFHKAAIDAGVPNRYLEKMIHYYSFDVDFQRDIKKGDSFEVLYELITSETGEVIKHGDILSMSLSVNKQAGGAVRDLYLFHHADGSTGYYDRQGVSVEKALLKTPISGARLSSGFGYRRHPILGYNKLHKGVDFAAPTGTPIYAAGNGIVEYAGRFSAYGKYIRIRHGGKYKTAYAHLSRFAKGIKKGVSVEQGQVIGYVGSTGRSTGPHLHYEILQGGKAVNPRKLKLPDGKRLSDIEIVEFRERYREIKRLMYSIRNGKQPLISAVSCNVIC